jgi:hypothetical protein
MSDAKCNLCDDSEGKAFRVPWSGSTSADAISVELMRAHLLDKHGETGIVVNSPPLLLDWKGQPGNIVARGRRGTYTIQTVANIFVLQGIDGECRNDLGFWGAECTSLDEAKAAAQEVDSR